MMFLFGVFLVLFITMFIPTGIFGVLTLINAGYNDYVIAWERKYWRDLFFYNFKRFAISLLVHIVVLIAMIHTAPQLP